MHPNDHVSVQSVPSVNRLHYAMLWCLGAGNASHKQLNVTFD